jgi:hypothetical protein
MGQVFSSPFFDCIFDRAGVQQELLAVKIKKEQILGRTADFI